MVIVHLGDIELFFFQKSEDGLRRNKLNEKADKWVPRSKEAPNRSLAWKE